MNKDPNQFSVQSYGPDFNDFVQEKYRYIEKLTVLLEDIKIAALGIDKQSKRELYRLETQVCKKLIETRNEVKKIIEQHQAQTGNAKNQGKLFDV
jgi:hypothetical protein